MPTSVGDSSHFHPGDRVQLQDGRRAEVVAAIGFYVHVKFKKPPADGVEVFNESAIRIPEGADHGNSNQ